MLTPFSLHLPPTSIFIAPTGSQYTELKYPKITYFGTREGEIGYG
jgi:hypothetical protein